MPTSTSRVIAIMIVVALATAALMGADAWTKRQRARTPAPAADSLAAGTGSLPHASETPPAATANPKQPGSQSPFTSDHGDELINE